MALKGTPEYLEKLLFDSDSAGSHKKILLENHVEHKDIRRKEFFPPVMGDGSMTQISNFTILKLSKCYLGHTLVEN